MVTNSAIFIRRISKSSCNKKGRDRRHLSRQAVDLTILIFIRYNELCVGQKLILKRQCGRYRLNEKVLKE